QQNMPSSVNTRRRSSKCIVNRDLARLSKSRQKIFGADGGVSNGRPVPSESRSAEFSAPRNRHFLLSRRSTLHLAITLSSPQTDCLCALVAVWCCWLAVM